MKGFVWSTYSDRRIPYNGYLCEEHYEVLVSEGASFKIIEYVSDQARRAYATHLVDTFTAYGNLSEFLASNPTLRGFPEAEWLKKYHSERQ